MWQIKQLTDKDEILTWLEKDRLYNAYAIGDLEPEWFSQCTWVGVEDNGDLRALTLLFRGLRPPALFLTGDQDGLHAILSGTSFPEWVYLPCREEHLPLAQNYYSWEKIIPMWRMALDADNFRPVQGECVRITPDHTSQLAELYAKAGGTGYNSAQVVRGVSNDPPRSPKQYYAEQHTQNGIDLVETC